MIGQREAIKADFEALFKAAADTGTMLEVNSSLNRLGPQGYPRPSSAAAWSAPGYQHGRPFGRQP